MWNRVLDEIFDSQRTLVEDIEDVLKDFGLDLDDIEDIKKSDKKSDEIDDLLSSIDAEDEDEIDKLLKGITKDDVVKRRTPVLDKLESQANYLYDKLAESGYGDKADEIYNMVSNQRNKNDRTKFRKLIRAYHKYFDDLEKMDTEEEEPVTAGRFRLPPEAKKIKKRVNRKLFRPEYDLDLLDPDKAVAREKPHSTEGDFDFEKSLMESKDDPINNLILVLNSNIKNIKTNNIKDFIKTVIKNDDKYIMLLSSKIDLLVNDLKRSLKKDDKYDENKIILAVDKILNTLIKKYVDGNKKSFDELYDKIKQDDDDDDDDDDEHDDAPKKKKLKSVVDLNNEVIDSVLKGTEYLLSYDRKSFHYNFGNMLHNFLNDDPSPSLVRRFISKLEQNRRDMLNIFHKDDHRIMLMRKIIKQLESALIKE